MCDSNPGFNGVLLRCAEAAIWTGASIDCCWWCGLCKGEALPAIETPTFGRGKFLFWIFLCSQLQLLAAYPFTTAESNLADASVTTSVCVFSPRHRLDHSENHLFLPVKMTFIGSKYPKTYLFKFDNTITSYRAPKITCFCTLCSVFETSVTSFAYVSVSVTPA